MVWITSVLGGWMLWNSYWGWRYYLVICAVKRTGERPSVFKTFLLTAFWPLFVPAAVAGACLLPSVGSMEIEQGAGRWVMVFFGLFLLVYAPYLLAMVLAFRVPEGR